MRNIFRKAMPLLLAALVLTASTLVVGCKSSSDTMYGRKQTNKAAKVKSNIKVKGSGQVNTRTTKSY